MRYSPSKMIVQGKSGNQIHHLKTKLITIKPNPLLKTKPITINQTHHHKTKSTTIKPKTASHMAEQSSWVP